MYFCDLLRCYGHWPQRSRDARRVTKYAKRKLRHGIKKKEAKEVASIIQEYLIARRTVKWLVH